MSTEKLKNEFEKNVIGQSPLEVEKNIDGEKKKIQKKNSKKFFFSLFQVWLTGC
jgi:hypothetical protein